MINTGRSFNWLGWRSPKPQIRVRALSDLFVKEYRIMVSIQDFDSCGKGSIPFTPGFGRLAQQVVAVDF